MNIEPFDISLCMIVKNEEKNLPRALLSVRDIVSEMIIVDTGSTDETISIAKSFGAQVICTNWNDHFGEIRNKSLELASKQWILVLDADEEFSIISREYLSSLLQQQHVFGYFIKMFNYIGEQVEGEYMIDSACRLFRNHPKIKFKGHIHEDVIDSIQVIDQATIEWSQLTIYHYGYLKKIIQVKEKDERNINIITKALQHEPENTLLLYALGTEHYQKTEYEKALNIFISLFPKVSVKQGFLSDILLKSSYILFQSGRYADALSLIDQGITLYSDFTDLLELKGTILFQQEKFLEAYEQFKKSSILGDMSHKYSSISGSGTYRAYYLLGIIYEKLYSFSEASTCYQQSLQYNINYEPAFKRWIQICLIDKDWLNVKKFFTSNQGKLPRSFVSFTIHSLLNQHNPKMIQEIWNAYYPNKQIDPFIKALLYIQQGKCSVGFQILNQIHDPTNSKLCLYKWAVYVKEEKPMEAMEMLKECIRYESKYQFLIDVMENKDNIVVSEEQYILCQQALIQTNSWSMLLFLYSYLLKHAEKVPSIFSFRYSFINQSTKISERFLTTLLAHEDKLNYGELCFVSYLLKDQIEDALPVILEARRRNLNRLEAPIAYSLFLQNEAARILPNYSTNTYAHLEFLTIVD